MDTDVIPEAWWDRLLDTGTTGLIILLGWFGLKSLCVWMAPRVSAWFDRQIELTETLISRNQKQDTIDVAQLEQLESLSQSQLGRTHAAEIGGHACDVLDAIVTKMSLGDEAETASRKMREAVNRLRIGSP